MKAEFVKHLSADAIVVLSGKTKKEVLEEIIEVASMRSSVDQHQLTTAVWNRERMMTTGVGKGLALPHIRVSGFGAPVVIVGICTTPIEDYESLDNEPVKLLVFIAAAEGDQDGYLKLLGSVSSTFKDPEMMEKILACDGKTKKVYKLLRARTK